MFVISDIRYKHMFVTCECMFLKTCQIYFVMPTTCYTRVRYIEVRRILTGANITPHSFRECAVRYSHIYRHITGAYAVNLCKSKAAHATALFWVLYCDAAHCRARTPQRYPRLKSSIPCPTPSSRSHKTSRPCHSRVC